MQKVWSFMDCTISISHPSVGQIEAVGAGTGSIVITRAQDMAVHDVGADGEVVTSKMEGKHGSITFTALQTSELNDFFMRWHNYLEVAPSSEFVEGVCNIKNTVTGESVSATRTTIQKMADTNMQAQQQSKSWGLLSESIVYA